MRNQNHKKPRLISIAGGTGRYSLLKGLKDLTDITALYNITDSGGSSGMLRVEHGVLPPGDGTQALAALANNSEDESFLLDRFFKGRVNGHRIANLMYEAATRKFGGDCSGILYLQKLFKTTGKVLPISPARGVDLVATLSDGNRIVGEHEIDTRGSGSPIVDATLSVSARILPEANLAIRQADIILFGPGDLWTSIIPHLLITGVPEAVAASKAVKIMVCNLVTKPGETDNYKAADFARVLIKYLGCRLDCLIVNSNSVKKRIYKRYAKMGQIPVAVDEQAAEYSTSVRVYSLATVIKSDKGELIRHDPAKTARAVMKVYIDFNKNLK